MYRLPENRGSQPRLDAIGRDQINTPIKKLFQKQLQVHVRVKRVLLERGDEIQIAGRSIFAANKRTKETQTSHAKAFDLRFVRTQGIENVLTIVLQSRGHVPCLLIS